METVVAIFFDFMGTLLDWHSSIVEALPHRLPHEARSRLAIAWREGFFKEIRLRFEQKLPTEDIDATHAGLLYDLATGAEWSSFNLTTDEKRTAVQAWHKMSAWPDVCEALGQLRKKYGVFVLANGTTRLQLDLVKSSGLHFDMLFSSQLLGLTKPDPEFYRKAMHLVGVTPEHSAMVAAHAYDLRAAKQLGMRTIYLRRWTEDTEEDMAKVKADVDVFLGDLNGRDGQLGGVVEVFERRHSR